MVIPAVIPSSVEQRIADAISNLTPTEKKVARAVLAEYPAAAMQSAAELASRGGTSAPSVVRFARSLGFAGYTDFQRAVRSDVQRGYTRAEPAATRGARNEDLQGSGEALGASVTATFRNIIDSEWDAVIGLLADPRRRIRCRGGSFTQVLAHYLSVHLRLLRPAVTLLGADASHDVGEVVDFGSRDVLVAFDVESYQGDTIELARAADERGASVVLFTDPGLSPVSEVADHVLVSEVRGVMAFESLAPMLGLVEALVAHLELRLGERVRSRAEEIARLRAATNGGAIAS